MKHVRRYQELFEAQIPLTPDQIEWLDECTKEKGMWSYNPETGLVDVDCTFSCSKQNLTDFKGVKFGIVKGDFYCDDNQLTSLEGAPYRVGVHFNCEHNRLTSLEGAPQQVGGSFWCEGNQLSTLEGAPYRVGGNFNCEHNQLMTLDGAPRRIGGILRCEGNQVSEPTLKALYKRMKSGMSREEAVEMRWDDMGEDDRALLAQYNPRLSPEEIKGYQALARLKKRVI